MRRIASFALMWLACSEPPPARAPVAAPSVPPVALAPAPPIRRVRISAAGDLVLNPHAMRALAEEGAYDRLLAGYASCVREDELAILNLEQPLVGDLVPLDPGWPRQNPSRPRRSPVLGATPALADALARADVDVVSASNNHSYDQGRTGLSRTLEILDRAGIRSAGAGATIDEAYAAQIVEHGGARVAFLSFSDFFNQRPRDDGAVAASLEEEARVHEAISSARGRADLVVVAVHWNRDFEPSARAIERRAARALIDAGADVILGTGPHVLHAIERMPSPRGEALVAYSLGNVASGMGRSYRVGQSPNERVHPANVRPEARDGLVLRATITFDPIAIEELSAVPLWTDNNFLAHEASGVAHEIRVLRLRDAREDVRAERAPIIRAAIGPAVALVD